MAKIIRAYEVEGRYFYRGIEGNQSGRVFYCDDNKVVGTITDKNGDRSSRDRRLFIGMHVPQSDLFRFLKISPMQDCLYPVVWSMRAEGERAKDGLSPKYKGFWAFSDDMPSRRELETTLMTRGMPSEERLALLDAQELSRLYFPEEIMSRIEMDGRISEQEGELRFTPAK